MALEPPPLISKHFLKHMHTTCIHAHTHRKHTCHMPLPHFPPRTATCPYTCAHTGSRRQKCCTQPLSSKRTPWQVSLAYRARLHWFTQALGKYSPHYLRKRSHFGIGYRKTPSPQRTRKRISEDQESCRLGLKLAPKSWPHPKGGWLSGQRGGN